MSRTERLLERILETLLVTSGTRGRQLRRKFDGEDSRQEEARRRAFIESHRHGFR